MTTPGVTLSGNIQNLTGSGASATLTIVLENAGTTPPVVSGTGLIAPTTQTVAVPATGAYSITIFGNYQISPIGTYYGISLRASDGSTWSASYQFTQAGTFDLSALTPMSSTPGAYLPNAVVTNPTGSSQTILGGIKITTNSSATGAVSAQWVGVGSSSGAAFTPTPSEELLKIIHAGTGIYGAVIQTAAGASNFNALYLNYNGTDHAIGIDAQANATGGILIDNHAGSGVFGEQISVAADANVGAGCLQLNGASGQTGNILQWTTGGNLTFAGAINGDGSLHLATTNSLAMIVANSSSLSVFSLDTSGKVINAVNGTFLRWYSDNFSTQTALVRGDTGAALFATLAVSGGTPTVLAGQVGLGTTTAASATAGAATLPANPVGFLEVNIGGTMYKIPYYAV